MDADVDVVLEGKTVRVHSHTLMAASDVFAKMLQSGMKESESGRIILKGKAPEDFRTLLQHIDLRFGASPPPIKRKNLGTLLSFAREYEMTGLKCRCDKFLANLVSNGKKDPVDALKVACDFDLHRVKVRTTRSLLTDDRGEKLLPFGKDPTVVNTAWDVLSKRFREDEETTSSDEEATSPKGCSSDWAALVEAAAAMHKDTRMYAERTKRALYNLLRQQVRRELKETAEEEGEEEGAAQEDLSDD